METESIDFEDVEYKDQLLGRLRDKVFHVTTAKAFESIRKDRFIYGNQDAKYPLNESSLKSFGRCRGWVCLFDLRGKSDEEIDNVLSRFYNFLRPKWFVKLNKSEHYNESRLVYLCLSQAYYNELVPNREVRKNDKPSQFIHEIECWYPGNIPIEYIEKSLCVRIRHNLNIDFKKGMYDPNNFSKILLLADKEIINLNTDG